MSKSSSHTFIKNKSLCALTIYLILDQSTHFIKYTYD